MGRPLLSRPPSTTLGMGFFFNVCTFSLTMQEREKPVRIQAQAGGTTPHTTPSTSSYVRIQYTRTRSFPSCSRKECSTRLFYRRRSQNTHTHTVLRRHHPHTVPLSDRLGVEHTYITYGTTDVVVAKQRKKGSASQTRRIASRNSRRRMSLLIVYRVYVLRSFLS